MKKQNLFSVITIAFIVLAFTACNSKTQDKTEMQAPTDIVAITDTTTNVANDPSSLKATKVKEEKNEKDEKDEKEEKDKKDKD